MKNQNPWEVKFDEDDQFISFKAIPEVDNEESIVNKNIDSLNQIKMMKVAKKRYSNWGTFHAWYLLEVLNFHK